ncbi:hypothetical protein NPIL_333341 [Nephila pilipes]|uniref:Uncharacterized protein n=1 Tax=Nephila pilipes TaxID=299642 RepID=A0A8X6N524_NEPPI|nr:hypothetical protein NPIL_333341 [Nephila pilipes]
MRICCDDINEITDDSLKTVELKQKLPDNKEFVKDEEFVRVFLATTILEKTFIRTFDQLVLGSNGPTIEPFLGRLFSLHRLRWNHMFRGFASRRKNEIVTLEPNRPDKADLPLNLCSTPEFMSCMGRQGGEE